MQTAQFQLHAEIEDCHWWFVARRQIMRRVVAEVLAASLNSVVVDIGCGTGANLANMADRYSCVGIDTSEEAITRARERFPAVRFLNGRAPEDLGQVMRQARLVMLMDVLEHVPDDFAMLSELLAAASPGTYFLLTVPADDSLWGPHDEAFGHFRRYDRQRLEQVWAGLPVSTLLISYFSARLLPLVRLVRARNRTRGSAAGRAGTDFWMPSRPVNRILRTIMAGEAKRIAAALRGVKKGYLAGSSLIALLRRDDGPIAIRRKPPGLPPDRR